MIDISQLSSYWPDVGQDMFIVAGFLLFGTRFLFRPKALFNYTYEEITKFAYNPLPSAKNVVRPEDFKILKWYRYASQAGLALLLFRIFIGIGFTLAHP